MLATRAKHGSVIRFWIKNHIGFVAMDPKVKALVASVIKDAESGPLLAGVNKVFNVLRQHGLLRQQRLEPQLLGVHPMNRDGYGISGPDTHSLLNSIFSLGFDHTQVNGVCVEVDPSSDTDIVTFNERIVTEAMGMLPAIPSHNLLYATLSASHTNAGLRCIAAQSPHDGEEMCLNGLLSSEAISQRDPTFARAAEEGLEWKVISRVCGKEFPQLLSLVQSALNSSGQVAKGEHELQILRRMSNLISTAQILTWL